MTAPKRLILWAGDGPLEAQADVLGYIETKIDEALQEAEEDTCWLNELMAYFRCLNGILRETGGQHLISERVLEWRKRTLAASPGRASKTSVLSSFLFSTTSMNSPSPEQQSLNKTEHKPLTRAEFTPA